MFTPIVNVGLQLTLLFWNPQDRFQPYMYVNKSTMNRLINTCNIQYIQTSYMYNAPFKRLYGTVYSVNNLMIKIYGT